MLSFGRALPLSGSKRGPESCHSSLAPVTIRERVRAEKLSPNRFDVIYRFGVVSVINRVSSLQPSGIVRPQWRDSGAWLLSPCVPGAALAIVIYEGVQSVRPSPHMLSPYVLLLQSRVQVTVGLNKTWKTISSRTRATPARLISDRDCLCSSSI